MKEWLKLQIGQLFSTNLWTPVTIIGSLSLFFLILYGVFKLRLHPFQVLLYTVIRY